MIGKKIAAGSTGSKSGRIGRLTAYIRAPEHDNSQRRQEKCIHAGARGFLTDTPEGQTAEMVALAQDAVRSRDPINHYVLSWRAGEEPSSEQVEEAVDLFLDELGLGGHQVIYGLHADTDNIHMHVVVNRVDAGTGKVRKIDGGFDIEAAHRAVARIEHAQGWEPELRARYLVDEAGKVTRATEAQRRQRKPQASKRDMENQTGLKSAERIAIEKAAPLIEQADSWAQLHQQLAKVGMRYQRVGSGAKVFVGEIPVKASRVSRGASFGRLQKRLGIYELPDASLSAEPPRAEPLRPDLPGWDTYTAARQAYYALKDRAVASVSKQATAQHTALREQQQARRDEVMSRNWKGKGPLLNAIRKALSQEQKRERAQLQKQCRETVASGREQWPRFPGLKQWLRNQGDEVAAEQWRHRDSAAAPTAVIEPRPSMVPAGVYTRYMAAWEQDKQVRAQRLQRLSRSNGRAWARHRVVCRLRWAAGRAMSNNALSRRMWAYYARTANQRDKQRLQHRHRQAVERILAQQTLPTFDRWITQSAGEAQEERSDAAVRRRGRGEEGTGRVAGGWGRAGVGAGRWPGEPHAAFASVLATARSHAGLRKLSEVALVFGRLGHAVLLPRDARRQLGQRRPETDFRLRRDADGGVAAPKRSRGRSR